MIDFPTGRLIDGPAMRGQKRGGDMRRSAMILAAALTVSASAAAGARAAEPDGLTV